MKQYQHSQLPTKQRGAVLITVVLLLFILTIIALGETSFNSIQTRVATNTADNQIAFLTAEGALNQAVTNVIAGNYNANLFAANTNGLYVFNPNSAPLWTTISWTGNSTIQSYQGNASASAAFFIEQLPSVVLPGQSMSQPTAIYRVTSRAVGASGNSPVILQALVEVPF